MAIKRPPLPLCRLAASLVAVGSLLLCTIGVSHAAQPAAHARTMTRVTLVLKWVPQAQFGGYYVALQKGYYARQGLDVHIMPGSATVAPGNVVAQGRAQFGINWLSALLAARDEGLPLVNIAQIFQASGMRMIAYRSSHIDSIAAFRGKRIGVWFARNQYQFYALMHLYHLSPPERYMHIISQPLSMDLFLHHRLDVAHAMTYNELGVVLEHGVKLNQLTIFDYNKLGVSILEDGIFARRPWLQAHPDVAVRFLRASIQGWSYAVAHPVDAARIAYGYAPAGSTTLHHQIFMAQEVASLIAYGPGRHHTIGYMDPAAYARTWQTLVAQHVIRAKPVGAYTQQYWQAAGGH